jgi:hypothetical protein
LAALCSDGGDSEPFQIADDLDRVRVAAGLDVDEYGNRRRCK